MVSRTTRNAIKSYMRDRLGSGDCNGAYPTLVGAKVYTDRYAPFQEEQLPVVVVFGSEETSEFLDITQDRRHLKVSIEVQATGDDAGTQLDIISDQIVDAFRNDEYLGASSSKDPNGLVEWCRYTGGSLYYDEKRHLNGVTWVLNFEVRYLFNTAPDPDEAGTGPFREVDITYGWSADDSLPSDVLPDTGSVIDLAQG